MTLPQIVGWAHSRFGKAPEETLTALIGSVVPEALAHAGIATGDVDGIFVGTYNNGFSAQAFEGALVGMAIRSPAGEVLGAITIAAIDRRLGPDRQESLAVLLGREVARIEARLVRQLQGA